MSAVETHYHTLGVAHTADAAALKAAHRALASEFHPDRNPAGAARMAAVNAAYACLTDPAAHKKYRAELKSTHSCGCPRCKGEGQTWRSRGARRLYVLCPLCQGVGLLRK